MNEYPITKEEFRQWLVVADPNKPLPGRGCPMMRAVECLTDRVIRQGYRRWGGVLESEEHWHKNPLWVSAVAVASDEVAEPWSEMESEKNTWDSVRSKDLLPVVDGI